ncbi:FecR family protein [uncultured Winogradskyella sp.]|uniref:FecR family protein n=1 Tax=uncultured Winogradskyella sp. TaxID=395353 RepID=UPI0026056997|nr:FecR family protein [uncultured Winogradskyella sp.]
MEKENTNKDVYLAKWLAGDLSDNQLKELVSSVDFDAFSKIRKGIEVYEQLEAPIDESFSKIQDRIKTEEPKVRPLKKYWSIAAAASVVLFFGLFFLLDNDNVSIETGFGEQKTIALLDGSEVIINSRSKVSYNKESWAEQRIVNLEGEAYFKVEKGNTFTVKTINGNVTVLGTQFNVISDGSYFDVVCYEGKVAVKIDVSEHVLLPSQTVQKLNGLPATSNFVQHIKPTWIEGESTFRSVPVKYVISALEKQYNITFNTIEIDDSVVFTGGFPHNNLKVALQTVFETLDIKYSEKENRNINLRY